MPALRSTSEARHSRHASAGHRAGLVSCLSILFSLSACRSSSAASDPHATPAKENQTMSTPATSDAPPAGPQLTARQAMERFLELIRSSPTVADITPGHMHDVMGVDIQSAAPGHYGYGQALPGNWAFSVERQEPPSLAPRVSLAFAPIPGRQASPDAVCEPDFAHFAQALQNMGFSRHASRGEHDRRVFDVFERPGMQVQVYPRAVLSGRGEPSGATCVDMVLIR